VTPQTIKPVERVLVIGLDGATWTNLVPLAERGEMPTLRRLMSEGAWGNLNSTIPALTPPAWTSLVTGTNPGKHGIYHFRHTPPGDYYQRRLNTSRDIHSPTLWQRLGAHGKQVGVINVPLSHPVYPVNGFMTSDAFAPEPVVRTHPPELTAELKDYIVDVMNYPTALPGTASYEQQMLAFIDENERVLLSQVDAAVRLMRTKPWQFFMIALMATDRLGHYCWKFSDPALAGSLVTDEQKRIGVRCRAVYRQLDAQIARLNDAAGADCALVIVSDHGFGPVPSAFFHTNRWLSQRGYLHLLPAWHWKRALHGYLPRSWKAKLRTPVDTKYGLVDWRRTKVWADPLESRAVAIRVNRAGLYPEGIVAESECESLLSNLVRELAEERTAHGEKVMAEIHRGSALFHGPQAEGAPDLVCILDKPFDVPASFRRDVRASGLIVPNRHVLRDGGHEPEGIFLLHGPNIRVAGQLPSQSIVSIAPTVLQLFGLPIADDIDGQPITAALTADFLQAHPPRRESAPGATPVTGPSSGQPEYSETDSAKVEERLRQLGYLD
jgi:predicted AlkP superfamily phosphohydrolase/phosphomutase